MAGLAHRLKRMEQLRRESYGEPLIISTYDMPITVFRGRDMELRRRRNETEEAFINRGKQWAVQNRLLVLDAVASLEEMEVADHADQ